MHFTLSIFFAALASTFVQSAPTTAVDAATLLNNGQAAQTLNAQFQNIKATDTCTTGESACVENAIAKCVGGQFDTSSGRCSKSQSCFAIPNVKSKGTTLTCTSEKSALSIINATGATGGVTGAGASDSSAGSSSASASGDIEQPRTSTTTVVASAPSASDTEIPDVVTVTVTLTPFATTAAPSTRTLSPDEASSIISSLLAQGTSTPSSSVTVASSSATSVTPFTVLSAAVASDAPAPTAISLTAAQVAESAASPASTTVSAAAAITPAPTSSSGGYGAAGSGYGGY